MTVADELKHTLRHSITLHQLLQNVVSEECVRLTNVAVEDLHVITARKDELEQEIERANHEVMTLFDKYYGNSNKLYSMNNGEIELLVGRLRESTHETIAVIKETIEAVKKVKMKVIAQVNELDNNKNAIGAYARTQ